MTRLRAQSHDHFGERNRRGLSVVFLTYNRSDLLEAAVASIRPALASLKDFGVEMVLSDDASDERHQTIIARLPMDRVVVAQQNSGLSHNHNKGLDACQYDYMLSLQDDWCFVGAPRALAAAIAILDQDEEIGIVNFIAPERSIPKSNRQLADGTTYTVFENDGLNRKRGAGYRPYSDRPHLKRASFVRDIGPYNESLPMTSAELDFQRRVACQQRWKVAHLHGPPPFEHLGADRTFNPGFHRAQRLERAYQAPVVGPLYRTLRTLARAARARLLWLIGRERG